MSHDFIQIIRERGFVHQMTDEAGLRALLATPGQKAYIGFDCTAKSLHVGSLLQIMLLRWWQKCGHTPIVLLGGGTTKIGDPSGKDESRPRLDDAAIADNMHSLKQVFAQFIDFDNALMVNNDDWLKTIHYIDFLRDYGRHFSVNRMMTMDSVKLRLERDQHLSFLEFNYMILQAYDFVELNRIHGCRVQMGGSDQWGNIVNGIELQRRLMAKPIGHAAVGQSPIGKSDNPEHEVFGITSPLITTASGAKMGKTAGGAVWLNAELLSPYDYWQFWRNTEDGDVERFLKLFTELPLDKIAELAALEGACINDAKKVLATEATALLHGRDAADRAAHTAAETFSGSGVSEDLPFITSAAAMLEVGVPLYSFIVEAGVSASNGEARRLIKGNGVRVNDVLVSDENQKITPAYLRDEGIKISVGKKRHFLVKVI
ncbi:MAG: tyrosine--tRNA ligase [Pseudomonadota bacterium]